MNNMVEENTVQRCSVYLLSSMSRHTGVKTNLLVCQDGICWASSQPEKNILKSLQVGATNIHLVAVNSIHSCVRQNGLQVWWWRNMARAAKQAIYSDDVW